jgi:predicted alpha-1,2-mannosidase
MSLNRRDFVKLSTLAASAIQARFATSATAASSSVDHIKPIIGASTSLKLGEGKTFPGPTAPFGMVQLGPDTITGGDNAPGYSYEHTSIEGFSFARMSGVGWFGDFGNLLVMPTIGELKTVCGHPEKPDEGWRSPYQHATETAEAGYYAVTLDRYHIRAEMTAAARAGLLRFTFPRSETARIQIDLARRIGGTSTRQFVKIVDDRTIEGWMECPSRGGGWGNGEGHVTYTLYFHAQFSKPMRDHGVWTIEVPPEVFSKDSGLIANQLQGPAYYDAAKQAHIERGIKEKTAAHTGFFAEFPTTEGEALQMKVGISFVDGAGAKANLQHDIPGWDFSAVRRQARAMWSRQLDRITIEGATETQQAIFATAMYHAAIDPRIISDADGRYRAADGSIQHDTSFRHRTIFSGWDVYRAELPLMTILQPDLVNDQICSLLELAQRSGRGYLERWEIMNAYSGCMDGDPAVAVIVDAYVKGIRNYDAEQAYAACRQSVAGVGDKTGRPDNEFYMSQGYVPDQISWTLDNAYFDWCTGRFAGVLGKREDAALFHTRGQNHRRIYDTNVGSMHARHRNGSWMDWKGATEFGQGCTESNPLQQTWSVPHDVYGLIEQMGAERFVSSLEDFFDRTPPGFGWNPWYNHSNEPVHHVPYLFVYVGKPWLTQRWVRRILDQAYKATVDGICGNDDVGQMSAWYIMSAMGFYPVCPGTGVYIIGAPLFRRLRIQLDPVWHKGRTFTVMAPRNSAENPYVQSVQLNGKPLTRSWIRHEEITQGGELVFEMGPAPNEQWGSLAEDRPPDAMKL